MNNNNDNNNDNNNHHIANEQNPNEGGQENANGDGEAALQQEQPRNIFTFFRSVEEVVRLFVLSLLPTFEVPGAAHHRMR